MFSKIPTTVFDDSGKNDLDKMSRKHKMQDVRIIETTEWHIQFLAGTFLIFDRIQGRH